MTKREVNRKQAERLWDAAKVVRVTRRRGETSAILSVRLPRETLRALTLAARAQDKGPGTLAREMIEQALAMQETSPPALIASVLSRLLQTTELQTTRRWTFLKEPRAHYPAGRPIPDPTTAAAGEPL
jgi:hypothetical protein